MKFPLALAMSRAQRAQRVRLVDREWLPSPVRACAARRSQLTGGGLFHRASIAEKHIRKITNSILVVHTTINDVDIDIDKIPWGQAGEDPPENDGPFAKFRDTHWPDDIAPWLARWE